jgi:hypothetical protein
LPIARAASTTAIVADAEIEDLKVSGMAQNHGLADAVLDCGFGEIRRQFQYKQAMRGGRVVSLAVSSRQRKSVRAAVALRVRKDARNCTSNAGFAANEASDTRVMRTPQSSTKIRRSSKVTRGDMVPLPACASIPARAVGEPRTETERICAHI